MIAYEYVAIKKTVIYQLLSKYKSSSKVNDEWPRSGRRSIITMTKLDLSIDKHLIKMDEQ